MGDAGRGRGRALSLRDGIAGVSVAMILIPQALAYAELAGLPTYRGLYAAALPPVAAAFFASSPYLQTGPVALTALLTLGALTPLAAVGTPQYVGMAMLLALVVGVTRLVVGIFRFGAIAYLMSEPVLKGFTTAAGILIVASQLPGALGVVEPPTRSVLPSAIWALTHPGSWEATSVWLSVGAIVIMRASPRVHPLAPGVVIATLLAFAFSLLTGYAGPRVGEVPTGLPPFTLDFPWSRLPSLILPGIVIAIVGFAEPASIARTFAAQDRQSWDPNREFLGQGVANLVAGFSGAFPVGGSFGRSTVNRLAGATSRWSGAVAGLAVLAFLPFADLIAPLPGAVLSAIVIAAVVDLIEVRGVLSFWKFSRPQALIAWITFTLTLTLTPHIEQAVVLGVLIAIGVHLWREIPLGTRSWTEGRTLHVELTGVLWFGSAPAVQEAFLRFLDRRDELDRMVLRMGGLGRIDLSGALVLRKLLRDAEEARIEVLILDVPHHARRILTAVLDDGLVEPGRMDTADAGG